MAWNEPAKTSSLPVPGSASEEAGVRRPELTKRSDSRIGHTFSSPRLCGSRTAANASGRGSGCERTSYGSAFAVGALRCRRALASGASCARLSSGAGEAGAASPASSAAPCSCSTRRLRTSAWRRRWHPRRGPEGALQGRARASSGASSRRQAGGDPATAASRWLMNRAFQRRSGGSSRAWSAFPSCSTASRPAPSPWTSPSTPTATTRAMPSPLGGGVEGGPAPARAAHHRDRAHPPAGRERPPPAELGAALRLLEHRRDQRSDAPVTSRSLRWRRPNHRDDPGESGTGKELIAHALHYNSPRAGKPFVKVSCAALPETLIEAELLVREGRFPPARQQRKQGRFDLAEGGTLFLDEIGELNPPARSRSCACSRNGSSSGWAGPRRSGDVRLVVATIAI